MNFRGCGHFINRKTWNTVYKDMIFIAPIEFIFFLVSLIGCSVDTKSTIWISIWLIFGVKLIWEKRFWIILWSICRDRVESKPIKEVSTIPSLERNNTWVSWFQRELCYRNFSGSDQKSNKKEVDEKYQSHKNAQSEDYCEDNRQDRKSWRSFAFHDNKGTNHSVIWKAFPSCLGEFRNKG